MTEPLTLRCLHPAPGLVWVGGGMPAQEGGLAAVRSAALFDKATPERAAEELRDAREVTLVPSRGGAPIAESLPRLRALAPEAVLRIEWWLEAGALPAELDAGLRAMQPLFVHSVVSQAAQIEGQAGAAMGRLVNAGVPVAAELVLRRGGLDGVGPVRALCLALLKLGVRPYYLVDGVWLPEAQRVPREAALGLVRGLRGWISGLAVPQLVEEAVSGMRTPAIPAYVDRLDDDGVEVVNFEGRRLRYTNPPEER